MKLYCIVNLSSWSIDIMKDQTNLFHLPLKWKPKWSETELIEWFEIIFKERISFLYKIKKKKNQERNSWKINNNSF